MRHTDNPYANKLSDAFVWQDQLSNETCSAKGRGHGLAIATASMVRERAIGNSQSVALANKCRLARSRAHTDLTHKQAHAPAKSNPRPYMVPETISTRLVGKSGRSGDPPSPTSSCEPEQGTPQLHMVAGLSHICILRSGFREDALRPFRYVACLAAPGTHRRLRAAYGRRYHPPDVVAHSSKGAASVEYTCLTSPAHLNPNGHEGRTRVGAQTDHQLKFGLAMWQQSTWHADQPGRTTSTGIEGKLSRCAQSPESLVIRALVMTPNRAEGASRIHRRPSSGIKSIRTRNMQKAAFCIHRWCPAEAEICRMSAPRVYHEGFCRDSVLLGGWGTQVRG